MPRKQTPSERPAKSVHLPRPVATSQRPTFPGPDGMGQHDTLTQTNVTTGSPGMGGLGGVGGKHEIGTLLTGNDGNPGAPGTPGIAAFTLGPL